MFYLLQLDLWLLSMQTLKKQEWAEFSWRHTVCNVKHGVETRLEYSLAIEYMYFQWL